MKPKSLRLITLLFAISLLIFSLTQKAYCTTSNCGDSLAVFIFGFLGTFTGGAALCWLANPLLIFSWLFIKSNKYSLLLSLISTLIAVSFLLSEEVIDDEAGNYRKIISYKLGYWLWLSSNLITLIGNIVLKCIEIDRLGTEIDPS